MLVFVDLFDLIGVVFGILIVLLSLYFNWRNKS